MTRLIAAVLSVCFSVGPCLAQTGKPPDVDALRAQAAQNSNDAAVQLGILYEHGIGVQMDMAQAVLWFEKAAAAGYGPAMTEIGTMYYRGYGLPQDEAKARIWWKRAVAAGDAKAARYPDELPQ